LRRILVRSAAGGGELGVARWTVRHAIRGALEAKLRDMLRFNGGSGAGTRAISSECVELIRPGLEVVWKFGRADGCAKTVPPLLWLSFATSSMGHRNGQTGSGISRLG